MHPRYAIVNYVAVVLNFDTYHVQHLRIINKGSSEGFSPWFLLLGSTSSAAGFLNMVTMQWRIVKCCPAFTFSSCLEMTAGIVQVGLQWGLFTFILVLYMIYYPSHLKYAEIDVDTHDTRPPIHVKTPVKSDEWKLSIALTWVTALHLMLTSRRAFITFTTFFLLLTTPTSPSPNAPLPDQLAKWATFLGVTSALLAAIQYAPQLLHTYKAKLVGALSIPMMCIQSPGAVFMVLSIALRPGTNWTSWITFAVSGIMQGSLLVMCIVFTFRQQRLGIDEFGHAIASDPTTYTRLPSDGDVVDVRLATAVEEDPAPAESVGEQTPLLGTNKGLGSSAMSVTPGKPRQSGIPGPGRASGIPTPGRSRASSTVIQQQNAPQADVEYMSRAFADAIKANDPAQHRSSYTNGASLSPQSASISQSGRRSVAGRPSSVASTSSVASSAYPPRAKTPVSSVRPPSRHSDVFGKSTTRAFEVGDNVRIESLGYEGTLRFLGEIEGKIGLWAGVELSGGFAGKGKNNGTVNGVYYFSCPDNCGVFVAAPKLSPPTVGVGAIPRPPSVASSRGGRVTPALSGRMTPSGSSSISGSRMTSSSSSLSNGRITPSISGRVTPSFSSGRITPGVTPVARARRTLTKSTTSRPPEVPVPVEKFTAGSRASKYMSMTAKQLSSRDAATGSPRHLESPTRSQSSPSHYARSTSTASPTRAPGSPFATPKPGLTGRAGGLPTPNKNRPSVSTPRARIPSAIAMPPPASPMSRSVSMSEYSDAINGVESDVRGPLFKSVSARSDSVASTRSVGADDRALIEQLQSRIDALEYDNGRLRALPPPAAPAAPVEAEADAAAVDTDHAAHAAQLQAAEQERDDAVSKIATLEAALAASKDELEGERTRSKSLEEENQQAVSALEDQTRHSEIKLTELKVKLDSQLNLATDVQGKVDAQVTTIQEKEALITAKDGMITSLESKLAAVSAELQDEKEELGLQIDELRSAGQETIALYEERINAADSQRYDLEQRILTLETRLQAAQNASAAPPTSGGGSSAAEIDNETLREQVLHLQRKISTLEDTLEDAQATAERDEAAMRERMKRLKEKEDAMRKELGDGRKEVDRVLKSEANARGRVEEIEEALRESTVALENARAEVEGLRAELANLDGLVANSTGGDLSSRVAEAAQRAVNDKARYTEEIAQLQESLERARGQSSGTGSDAQISSLRQENTLLQDKLDDQAMKLEALLHSLDETSKELESLKKKNNRDATINGLQPMPASPSSKHDISAAREEITGLKHIVQELQKETLASAQRIKMLESENQLLSSEANQLRQEVQILEENLDKSLDQEEIAASSLHDSPRKMREQQSRLEVEQEQLRKKLVDAEMKSARTIHDLNKEISELEALVESKIYREDELEQEVERLREKVARQSKKAAKSSTDTIDSRNPVASSVCEICEREGHDIFSCDVLNKEGPARLRSVEDLYCEDCESHGHSAADCPHSLDVF
ncbi:hypothetical protein DXG03_000620 [Asterophora parasitica]|uniref:CAP-Gly domain-containing protein n=1 Tax=Asterophora parasitica TaxID=117018 RepID=A0A9P7GAF3_9AGAR|nr:hypothetical protein DXG03_000620 [Asterophora parasitica]